MKESFNRDGLIKVLTVHSRVRVAERFGVSVMTLRQYEKGTWTPKNHILIRHMNKLIDRWLSKPLNIEDALMSFANHYANHRLSLDASKPGPDCECLVLRYPLGECNQRFERQADVLYIDQGDFNQYVRIEFGHHSLNLLAVADTFGCLLVDLTVGCGLKSLKRVVYKVQVGNYPDLKTMLLISSTRDDPEQDGRVSKQEIEDATL